MPQECRCCTRGRALVWVTMAGQAFVSPIIPVTVAANRNG